MIIPLLLYSDSVDQQFKARHSLSCNVLKAGLHIVVTVKEPAGFTR